ncbi:unnamed protein product [Linum trigynum]|uniref:Uncharacterized protein n=1 Tax=Linum trigynum TaxID=586398 RepID=A0AAV2F8V8_9ROSI
MGVGAFPRKQSKRGAGGGDYKPSCRSIWSFSTLISFRCVEYMLSTTPIAFGFGDLCFLWHELSSDSEATGMTRVDLGICAFIEKAAKRLPHRSGLLRACNLFSGPKIHLAAPAPAPATSGVPTRILSPRSDWPQR